MSCHHPKNNQQFSENVIEIKKTIFIDETSLMDPWSILYHDSLIIIANYKGEPLIEVYDVKKNQLGKFLNYGNGPEEILTVGGLQKSLNNDDNIYVYDLHKKYLFEYRLKNIFQHQFNPDTVYNYSTYIYNYQKDSTALFDKLLHGNGYLIGESRDPRGRIVLLNFDGRLICFGGKYPPNELYKELPEYEYANLFSSAFVLNNNGSKLAMATYSADMIDIFDLSDYSNPKLTWSHEGFLPHDLYIFNSGNAIRAAFTKKSRQGYSDITASDRYIYLIYSGRKVEEKNYSYGNIIRVLSWDGAKKIELHADIELRRITVTPDDKMIYAIAKDEDDNPVIVTFNIEKIIEDLN
jgi:hypothetical protein